MPNCPHKRTTFSKIPGSRLALIRCLDCDWQESMSLTAAYQKIIELAAQEENNV